MGRTRTRVVLCCSTKLPPHTLTVDGEDHLCARPAGCLRQLQGCGYQVREATWSVTGAMRAAQLLNCCVLLPIGGLLLLC